MKKTLFSTLVFLWTFTTFSQTNYEKGYYLDNQGNKNEGYFKIIDFEDINEKSFKSLDFKKELSQDATELPIENITEFGIAQDIKYQKMSLQMDDVNLKGDFDGSKDLDLKPSILFLNVLVEGNANLYAFDSDNMTKYFYKINDKDNKVNQLVYKKYLNSEGGLVENAYFRQQMFNNVKCENQTFNEFLNINYDKNKLVSFFENFNKCQNSPYVVYKNKFQKNIKFNFTAFAGVHLVMFGMNDVSPSTGTSSKGMFGVGIEGELLLPSEKWSLYVKSEYGSINTETSGQGILTGTSTLAIDNYKLDIKFIDLLFGSRWYHSFEKAGKCFIGAGIGLDFPSGSLIRYRTIQFANGTDPVKYPSQDSYSLGTNAYFNFELGYTFSSHYGIVLNLDTSRNFLGNTLTTSSVKFNRTGLNLRYTF